MEYDRGESFSFDFEPNGIPFGSIDFFIQIEFLLVQNREKNCHHDHIPYNFKGNINIFFILIRRRLRRS